MQTAATPTALQRALNDSKGAMHRLLVVDRAAINVEARTADLAFASEAPVERYWGIEVLNCASASMRMTRLNGGANLLCDHNITDVVGVVESVSIGADRVARARVRFGRSARAEEVWQDVVDGIRRNVSVGYMIHAAQLTETRDGMETYRVTDWEPFEVSLVSVPADTTVGIGRSMQQVCVTVEVTQDDDDATEPDEDDAADPAMDPAAAASATSALLPATSSCLNTEDRIMSEPNVSTVEQRNHPLEITTLAASIKGAHIPDLALKSIQAGHTVEQFQTEVLRSMASHPLPTADIGLSTSETRRYSVLRSIRSLIDPTWQGAGLEREVHKAILKRNGMEEAPNNGIFVPYEVQQRDLTAGSPSGGGYTVATNNLASSFIDLLRNRAVVGRAGATMLSGLQGNVTIPKQTGANTAYWLANEATAITEGNLTFGQLSLTPKNVGAYQEVSRQLIMQSDPSVDALVMNDLSKVLALAIDLAVLEGSGSSGQPTGISNTAGIGSVTGTSIAWSNTGILKFQTDVAGANALADNCAYITTPAIAALLIARQRFSSTDSPIWMGNVLEGTIAGFRALATLQVTAASMVFGDFSQVIIADWGQLELALNPYANFAAAITGIRAIQTVDVGVRIGGAFSRATSIT